MKKIKVYDDRCIGCGYCVQTDEEHFDFDDAGFSTPISQENLDSEALQEAISGCPVVAIELVEETNENNGE